ncbi:plantaricin C family lantibiotic [Clostridium sp. 19966]|uniref:plantaricin C family lantibiotic n=1 Tax=Clostridium sp. 19966 TaxID=2768166 RepID=UPI0028DF0C0F|nr:plantaricin C family lantibiotic [Clostridium sp. 19966]MDT8715072.1 plantaricin C family lantibiotic [Clostridium sp. 19966]
MDMKSNNVIGSLVEELQEQDMNKIAGGMANSSWGHSQEQAREATVAGPGAFCTLSAECNLSVSC